MRLEAAEGFFLTPSSMAGYRYNFILNFRSLMKFSRILFVILFFNLSFNTTFSQEMKFDHYSVDKGLSQGNVWDILQDKYGFVWIGTEDGLNKFDGYSFTVYKSIPDDPGSLTSNNINSIAEDQDGYIWIATREGLNKYDRVLNQFEQFLHDPNDPNSIKHNNISNVYCDSKNNVWVCTNVGLSLYNRETNGFQTFLHDENNPGSLVGNFVRCIVEDKNNRIWVGTMRGLSMMNPDNNSFVNFVHDPADSTSLSSNQIMSIYVDSRNTLWIGSFDNGLNAFNPSSNSFTRYLHDSQDPEKLMGPYVYNISEDPQGNIWISNDGALCLLDQQTGKMQRYLQDLGNEFSLNSNIITDVYFDNNERMWVCTRFGGVNVYDKGKYIFQHLKHNSNDPESLSANNIQGMDEDSQGNLWIGIDGGGLNKWNRETGDFEHFRHDPNNPNSIMSDKILTVEVDQFDDVWTGMWDGGVTRFNPKTNRYTRYLHDPENPNSLSDDNIFDFLLDSDGEMWIATWGNGISKYNRETDDFTQYTHDPNNPNSIGQSSVVCLYQDRNGIIWMGTENEGIYGYDKTNDRFVNYQAGNQEGSLSSNGIYSIFEDSNNRLWIGTSGSGLNLFNREIKKFTSYRASDGLPNESIVGILEDDEQNLWLSTNSGVCKFNPDSVTFKNYTMSDGLQGDQFNRWSYLKLSSGELLFGGTNGFNIFNPEDITDNQFIPPVYITDFKLFNKDVPIGESEILTKSISFTDEIILDYSQNIISFEFTALNYRQTEKNQYKYILEGFHDDWVDAGTERKVNFTNLDPGDYIFRVKGSNNNGIWNDEGVSLSIIVVPPFWRTGWFISLMVLIVISGIYGYLRYQRIHARKRQLELESVIEERTGEIKKQSEEILKRAELEKTQNWITQGLARFGEIISKHKGSLSELSDQILKNLIDYVKASVGVIAILDDQDNDDIHLKILSTYGVVREDGNRIEINEGLIGAAYSDKEKIVIEEVPENYMNIESGLGNIQPEMLVLLPLKIDSGEVLGVIELAFMEKTTDIIQGFLDEVSHVIALNLHAANLNNKTMLLLQNSKEQAEELRAQEEEMRQNLEEMEATQEEYKRREEEYVKQIKELKAKLKKNQ